MSGLLRCETCGSSIDRVWRWCPDCGSYDLSQEIDLRRPEPDRYAVDWVVLGGPVSDGDVVESPAGPGPLS